MEIHYYRDKPVYSLAQLHPGYLVEEDHKMTVLALFEDARALNEASEILWERLEGHFWVLSLDIAPTPIADKRPVKETHELCFQSLSLSPQDWELVAGSLRQGHCALLVQPQSSKTNWLAVLRELGAQRVLSMNGGSA